MKGYKGFDNEFKCKGKQYQENTFFEEDEADICKRGMHFCKNPLDVLDYYPLIDDDCNLNQFAEVEALDEVFTNDNKKYCTKKLKVGAKLNLKGLIEASFDFLFNQENLSDEAQLASSGDYAQLASSGNCAQLASSGDYAQLASSGNYARLASSGDCAQLASSGDYARLASSGNCARLASSGYYARLASSGNCAQLASSGDYARLASSGDYAQLASSGDYARLASSGDYARLAIEGESSVGANIGIDGIIKGCKGTWITLAEYEYDEEKYEYVCVCVKSAQIDGEILKEDTWYQLKNGEFVEV